MFKTSLLFTAARVASGKGRRRRRHVGKRHSEETIPAWRKQEMRLIILALSALALSAPAAAQNWQEYNNQAYAFTVAFPADPQIETTTYRLADGRSVEAHVYSVRFNNGVFKVTVAELGNTGLEESAVIDHAIKTLSEGGEVKINIPHRVYRVYGRQLSIAGADGGRSTVA